jgi:tetratricopeptide (TPR) repeat protein
MDARTPTGATIEGLMAPGSRRRLPALLLACLAALSTNALAADPEPSSDPLAAGEAAWDAGDYDGARAYFESALAIAEARKDSDLTEAEALGRIGAVLLEQGECREAASYDRHALAILEAAGSNAGPLPRAEGLHRLAGALAACGDLKGAERERRRALEAWTSAGAESSRDAAFCLADLAEDCRKLGKTDEARGHFLRARVLLERLYPRDDPRVATTILGLGEVAEADGDFDRARAFYRETVAIRRRSLGSDHPFLAEALADYARALMRTGNMGDAVEASLEAESIRRALLRYTVRALPERQALSYEGRLVSGLDVAVAAGVRTWDSTLVERVWDSVVRSRGVVLDEMASRHHWSDALGDSASDDLIASWTAVRQRLAHLAVRGPLDLEPEVHRAALDTLEAQSERAERALLARSALRAEGRRSDAGFRDVVAELPKGTALVSLVRYEDPLAAGASWSDSTRLEPGAASYAAFVTRGVGSPAWAIPLGSADEIDSLVTLWRDQVSRPAKGNDALGAAERRYSGRLRQRLWDPIEARLRGVTRVVLIPDGSLHLVNPIALRREDGRFLVENGPVFQIVSSERDLIGPPTAGRPGAGFLGIADPDFDAPPSDTVSMLESGAVMPESGDDREVSRGLPCVAGDTRPQWERLPGSAREVEEAAALWQRALGQGTRDGAGADDVTHPPASPQARLLLGRAASEDAFRRLAGGRRILHVATHGVFADACPAWSDDSAGVSLNNPLLRAGLVLAGANLPVAKGGTPGQDGILTADEIAAVDLSGVETAVLSGCETGVGVVRAGEGVFGLRRAFEIAGVRTLVLSLWPVTDRAARAWTTRFYQSRLIGGQDAAAAAHEASRGVLDARKAAGESTDPIYWAAFIAAGR